MINVSLARIMYGTNEDLHAWHSMNAGAVPSLVWASGSISSTLRKTSSDQETLGGLLQKAWAALSHKG